MYRAFIEDNESRFEYEIEKWPEIAIIWPKPSEGDSISRKRDRENDINMNHPVSKGGRTEHGTLQYEKYPY
jgi:hypothetical protein